MSERTCKIEGCDRKHRARGWCRLHYYRVRNTGTAGPVGLINLPTEAGLLERFNRYGYSVEGDCWRWMGPYYTVGYGIISMGGRKNDGAHRVSYRIWNGTIPEGMHVCHRCDNPWCVNPDHLFLGTVRDNMADMRAKRRSAHNERNGMHRLTDEEVAEIRAARAAGVPGPELAAKYGVTAWYIYALARHQFRRTA